MLEEYHFEKVKDFPFRDIEITIDRFDTAYVYATYGIHKMKISRPKRNCWIQLEIGMKKTITIKRRMKAGSTNEDRIENYYPYIHVIGQDNESYDKGIVFKPDKIFIEDKEKRNVGKEAGPRKSYLSLQPGVYDMKIIEKVNRNVVISLNGNVKKIKIPLQHNWGNPKIGETFMIEIYHRTRSNGSKYGIIERVYQ